MPNFIYSPLDFNSNEIRLLRFDTTIYPPQWTITHASLDQDLIFDALSYTWGDEKSQERIIISGKVTRITSNLAQALADIRPTIGNHLLWVDALCIDQENILERNHQVQKMAKIYQKARRVHAWLGRPEKPSENFSFLSFLVALLGDEGGGHISENLLSSINESKHRPFWTHIAEIVRLPYWNRLWIVQEIGLASALTVHYGSESTDWKVFALFRKELAKICLAKHCPGWFRPIAETILQSIPALIEEQREDQHRPAWLEKCYMDIWIYIRIAKLAFGNFPIPSLDDRVELDRSSQDSKSVNAERRESYEVSNGTFITTWIAKLEMEFCALPPGIENLSTQDVIQYNRQFLSKFGILFHTFGASRHNSISDGRVGQDPTSPHKSLDYQIFTQELSPCLRMFLAKIFEVDPNNITPDSASMYFSALHARILAQLRNIPLKLQQHWRWQPLPLKLHKLIENTERSQCREPRDKIYGLLGLASDFKQGSIKVDYSMPMFKVYQDVLKHTYASESRSVDVCTMILGLPRFSQLLQRSLGGPFPNETMIEEYHSAQLADNAGTSMFKVVGFIQGSILPLEAEGLETTPLAEHEIRRSLITEVLENVSRGRWPREEPTFIECLLERLSIAREEVLAPIEARCCYATRITDEPLRAELEEHMEITHKRSKKRPRLFSEDSGLIGLGPSTMREDDLLCQFASCDVAVIIRPMENHFRLIGRALVLRHVQGERRRTVSKSSPELFLFNVPKESLLRQNQWLYFYLDAHALQALTCPAVFKSNLEYAGRS